MTGEVFTRMLAALPRYQPTATPFRAWLYRIAHNLVVDHYRKEGGRTFLSLDQAEAQSDEAGDLNLIVEWNLTIEQVHHALARLDEAQREVVSLRFLSGLSLQEVAAALEKSEGAIKALQHRGLAALPAEEAGLVQLAAALKSVAYPGREASLVSAQRRELLRAAQKGKTMTIQPDPADAGGTRTRWGLRLTLLGGLAALFVCAFAVATLACAVWWWRGGRLSEAQRG